MHGQHSLLCSLFHLTCFLLCAQAKRGLTGIMNYTNPGAISHNEIMELYKSYVDPEFTWKNFTVEEQAEVIKAPRSNNLLDTTRVRACTIIQTSSLTQGVAVSTFWRTCASAHQFLVHNNLLESHGVPGF